MAELVAAVEYAEKVGAVNPFWGWDQDTRRLFREYHKAMHSDKATPPTEQIQPGAQQEDAIINQNDDDITNALAQSDDEPDPTVAEEDGDKDGQSAEKHEEVQPVRKKKNSRWIEYCGLAREQLRKETGKQKIPQSDVFALSRRWIAHSGCQARSLYRISRMRTPRAASRTVPATHCTRAYTHLCTGDFSCPANCTSACTRVARAYPLFLRTSGIASSADAP